MDTGSALLFVLGAMTVVLLPLAKPVPVGLRALVTAAILLWIAGTLVYRGLLDDDQRMAVDIWLAEVVDGKAPPFDAIGHGRRCTRLVRTQTDTSLAAAIERHAPIIDRKPAGWTLTWAFEATDSPTGAPMVFTCAGSGDAITAVTMNGDRLF